MNKLTQKEIIKLSDVIFLNTYNLASSFEIDLLTNFVQESQTTSVLFYNITDKEKFWKHVDNLNYGILVVNENIANLSKLNNVFVVGRNDFLEIQKDYCDYFYPNKKKCKLVGVTGTNGKTTVTTFCSQISKQLDKKALAIGTVGVFDGKTIIETLNQTTPNYIDLRKLIHKYQDLVDCIFLEVSSHGLVQKRLYKLKLEVVAWTNLSQDHLDYHKDMADYFDAKCKISEYSERAVLIAGDQLSLQQKIVNAGVKMVAVKSLAQRDINVESHFLKASFNKSNLELALELNEVLWGDIKVVDVNKLEPPKGRFSLIEIGPEKFAIIDYAHTPDALKNVLIATKSAFNNFKIKVLFGCGGDRDISKRKIMGAVAYNFADFSYLTSDNPRSEDPLEILRHIREGYPSKDKYFENSDRKASIKMALNELKANEILVIAGKGHEEYQETKGVKNYYSDFAVVKEYIDD